MGKQEAAPSDYPGWVDTRQNHPNGGVDPTTLAAPLRARLAEICAEAIAQTDAGELPQQVRPVARFAPAKRARSGEQVLLGALGDGSRFRELVRSWAEEHRPELVDLTAPDPVHAAAAAVLRAEPTAAHLAELVAMRAGDATLRAERDSALAKLNRVSSELAELREHKQTRGEHADTEADKLRSRLREKGTQLRSARDEADAASAALAELRAETELEVKRIEAERDAERARAEAERERARMAAQEAATARAAAKQARAADETRLALLVETIEGAAAGLRGELGIGEPGVRPADLVEGASAARGSSTQVRDVGALDALLRMPAAHLIVDGYNVTKTGYPELSLVDQRDRLARQLAALAARTGAECTLVFDGAGVTAHKVWPRGVRVLFSEPDVQADDVIRDLVAAEPHGRPLVVATSDREVVRTVRSSGAHAVSSPVLVSRLSRV